MMAKGKSMSEKHLNLLKGYINTLNDMIQNLKQEGIEIHDDKDFDFVISSVSYSPTQDKVLVKFTDAEIDEIQASALRDFEFNYFNQEK